VLHVVTKDTVGLYSSYNSLAVKLQFKNMYSDDSNDKGTFNTLLNPDFSCEQLTPATKLWALTKKYTYQFLTELKEGCLTSLEHSGTQQIFVFELKSIA
jgi:hypothetical protein